MNRITFTDGTEVTYDPEARAVYVNFGTGRGAGVTEPVEGIDWGYLNVDYDIDGKPVGVEIIMPPKEA